ncbi:preprotein translocase subunit SecG [Mucilaginibacter yixingensis]|uniref:Protein-export membrane protein SecG n=1 Tax=Mucilaginibacter yixingensis TaxID=1295612 RepID=A0A2T5JCJ3_9SPHI|nr:preprotein translocase subunit SecG [Mucilaginibacter yixingensis]PTQ99488.1 preprotein translocase subunit SecG [Mucilaginibacter yixingensis]
MTTLLIIITLLVCVLLGIIVLIQNPKGGGLTSNFSSSSQLMGVQKTGDFLEKGTWVLAVALMVLSLGINVAAKSGSAKADGGTQNEIIDKASKPTAPVSGGIAPLSTPAQKSAPATGADSAKN